jgi:murein DD-endopeptidase MepM/ murein hydrolase activator NlpD
LGSQPTPRLLLAIICFATAEAVTIPPLVSPIGGMKVTDVRDTFTEIHNGHPHEATDIMEPRGTPVLAVVDGNIRKLFLSKPGGNTIYEFDTFGKLCYYYAHLDRYATGLHEGQKVKAGEVIGYVGSTGNANPNAPHLHFGILEPDAAGEWWKGTWINPYSALVASTQK